MNGQFMAYVLMNERVTLTPFIIRYNLITVEKVSSFKERGNCVEREAYSKSKSNT